MKRRAYIRHLDIPLAGMTTEQARVPGTDCYVLHGVRPDETVVTVETLHATGTYPFWRVWVTGKVKA